jgi:hypothetical protein
VCEQAVIGGGESDMESLSRCWSLLNGRMEHQPEESESGSGHRVMLIVKGATGTGYDVMIRHERLLILDRQ